MNQLALFRACPTPAPPPEGKTWTLYERRPAPEGGNRFITVLAKYWRGMNADYADAVHYCHPTAEDALEHSRQVDEIRLSKGKELWEELLLEISPHGRVVHATPLVTPVDASQPRQPLRRAS